MARKRLVVLTGSGISAESGLMTFRDSGGLWEGYNVYEVATPEAWAADPGKVLHFYNLRRAQAAKAEPNPAHLALAKLEDAFEVQIITQNVDDLHERAGSTNVSHLHGELTKARSVNDESLVVPIEGAELNVGDLGPDDAQLRPHIVWFGEAVPMMDVAIELTAKADLLVIVGTSLQVYPAASLVDYVAKGTPTFVVDPSLDLPSKKGMEMIAKRASEGVPELAERLRADYA